MWIIQQPDGTLFDRGNLPSTNILSALQEEFPQARIYRSKKPCHNEFGALAFVKEWVQDGEREVVTLNEEGNEVRHTEPIMALRRRENPYAIEGTSVVVYDADGNTLGSFDLEVVYDGHSTPDDAAPTA